MDKSWMSMDRRSPEYNEGVEEFLKIALLNADSRDIVRCPCTSCVNLNFLPTEDVRYHLFSKGIDQRYRTWIWHGEELPPSAPSTRNANDVDRQQFQVPHSEDVGSTIEMVKAAHEHCSNDPDMLKKLLEDAEKPLYPGCTKFTKLSAVAKLYKLKASNGFSDKSFTELLILLGDILPDNNELPLSVYEAKKTLTALGLEYEKIHACPNNCILYRKDYNNAIECPKCGMSRWKENKHATAKRNGVPAKVLWYFPPIPRFRRMFQTTQIARDLTWHARKRIVDGELRHPADSVSWKLVDHLWPEFKAEPRHLRLAISADGINPHSTLNSKYSCWPIILVTYNLPPWLCMKRKFMMLSLLISGPQQPSNNIDVYLAPLIDDLKLLWEVGVEVYDAYQQQSFNLRAVLLWTINDFPAYGNLSGCVVKGYKACPICSEGTDSIYLPHGKKNVYVGHIRFLPDGHQFRNQKRAFNGEEELRKAPKPLSGEETLRKVEGIKKSTGSNKKRKSKASKDVPKKCWNKKSIFFELEYWKHLYVRHNLDVMHIEKNVCESIIGTLLNIPNKTKDGVNARRDWTAKGLREKLAPQDKGNRIYLPPAGYTLSKEEKKRVCQTLFELKVPEGYSSNFSNLVSMKDLRLVGFKSHDCHILMQQLLPVAIRSVMPKHVRYAITRFCLFFKNLCSKVVDVTRLTKIQDELVVTLCLLEKYFPPSFFDIMVHVTVHLVREVQLCGPVHFRWMYPFERFMKVLKGYVRNRNHPEGCIAECYIAEEAVEFCTDYLSDVDAIGIPSNRNLVSNDVGMGRPLPGGQLVRVEKELLEQAHRYVLANTNVVQPYIDEHMAYLRQLHRPKSKGQKWIQDEHNRTFIYWIREKVEDKLRVPNQISSTLKWIAHGPVPEVTKFPGYIINGCRYHTKDRDNSRVNQNSGVSIVATSNHFASAKDKNPISAAMCYYGVIIEIWLLNYHLFEIPVFKCDWVDVNNGIKIDDLGFTLVDLNRIGPRNDSFILASQARQIFYVKDQLQPRWSVVLTSPQRVDVHEENDNELGDGCVEHIDINQILTDVESFDDFGDSYVREECEGIWVEPNSI